MRLLLRPGWWCTITSVLGGCLQAGAPPGAGVRSHCVAITWLAAGAGAAAAGAAAGAWGGTAADRLRNGRDGSEE